MMEERLDKLAENMTEELAEHFEQSFSDFGADASLSEEQTERILSSFMRKAGAEMNDTDIIKENRYIRSTKQVVGEESRKGRIQLKRGGAIAACIAVLAAGGVIFSFNNKIHHTVPNNDRDSSMVNETSSSEIKEADNSDSEDKLVSRTRTVQEWAKPYLEQNEDTVGYLRIKDLTDSGEFSSPVVQGEDNMFYLYHGFDKEENGNGTVFADCNVPIDENGQPDNIVLYGFFAEDGSDISSDTSSSPLLKYKDSEFFEEHKTIDFCTIFDDPDTKYQVISCLNYKVTDEDFTDYWIRAREFGDEYSFDKWLSNIKEGAINISDIECTENDDYITLDTKDPENGENGRFVVIAKKVAETADEETTEKEETCKDKTKEDKSSKTDTAVKSETNDNNRPDTAVSKDNDTKDHPADTSDAQPKKDSVMARLYEKYKKQAKGITQINDDRYLIDIYDVEHHGENNKYIIYDASRDSEVITITTDMVNPYVFANKFVLYKYNYTENYACPHLYASVYDDNGNVLHEYSVDTYIGRGYHTQTNAPVFNNDGSRMFFVMEEKYGGDPEIYYADSGDSTPRLLNKDSLKGKTVNNWAATDDAIITECFGEVMLISADPDHNDHFDISDLVPTDYQGWPSCGSFSNGYLYYSTYEGDLAVIAPDDAGDIQLGSKRYTIKSYDMGGNNDTWLAMSYSGRYLVASYRDYSDSSDTMFCTLYEIGKDSLTEIKKVDHKILKPEYNMWILGGYFDESTGIFTYCRERSTTTEEGYSTGTYDYTYDIINFFE